MPDPKIPTVSFRVIYNTTEEDRDLLKNQGVSQWDAKQLPGVIYETEGNSPWSFVSVKCDLGNEDHPFFLKGKITFGKMEGHYEWDEFD